MIKEKHVIKPLSLIPADSVFCYGDQDVSDILNFLH